MTAPLIEGAVRKAVDVSGIVQGVGFRPFVYRLAQECNLAGYIVNTSAGVTIEIQGSSESVENFLRRLSEEAPPLSKVTSVEPRDLELQAGEGFHILASEAGAAAKALISPDVATCEDCLREMNSPRDRRFRYPFINCTNCGPRFTIIKEIPYDRARTSMAPFKMCPSCQAEYDDPANRRFHAQPNACWDCGPQLQLLGADGMLLDVREPVRETANLLQQGKIVAIKGLGGFHLACDAANDVAVTLLRERKRRVEKPFAVMLPRVEAAEALCEVDEVSRRLLLSKERPIVLCPKREAPPLAEGVAPGNSYLGIFLPYTPLHTLLLASGKFRALVMTSGNLSEEPIAIENDEAVQRLASIADAFLVHNRDIVRRCDDSVVRVGADIPQLFRRSRGYVPVPVVLESESVPILAVGGELKNTVCLVRGAEAFLSQHIGDLENLESYSFFEEAREHLQHILEVKPTAIAYDLHPDYFSTKWALTRTDLPLIGVQHHHAHIAACMAENHLDDWVIGIALDGTGYGTDGAIWGGEVLVADYSEFQRAAHFAYIPLPGGSAAIHEPWRTAVSYLFSQYGRKFTSLGIPMVNSLDPQKLGLVLQMIERQVNSPMTSSCGRLFDAVAATIGLRKEVNFEAQAAMELEMAARISQDQVAYPFEIVAVGEKWEIGTRRLFEYLLKDLQDGVATSTMARRFHNGLTSLFVKVALKIRERTNLHRVCLSGGCFQNLLLFESLLDALREKGFEVYFHSEVPAGDGGISLGQAAIAARRLQANHAEN